MFDQPGSSRIKVLDPNVNGILKRIVPIRGRDEGLPVPAACGPKPIIDGDADPALFAEMVIQRIAQRIHPRPHGPGAAERVYEHRALPFRFPVPELIDVHQKGLAVTDNELDRGPVRPGHDLRLSWPRTGMDGLKAQNGRRDWRQGDDISLPGLLIRAFLVIAGDDLRL